MAIHYIKHNLCLTLCTYYCLAGPKDKQTLKLQVVDTQTSQREFSQYIPGTAARGSTNCNGNSTTNATLYGAGGTATTYGTANCTTTSTAGQAPSVVRHSVEQVHVQAVTPDGRHITLGCQPGFRRCTKLSPSFYSAKLAGNSVWMHVYDLDGITTHTVKYRFEGSW
jgi:hypothetical protein